MIKLPEPFLVRHEDVCGDEVGPPTPCHTETQLKQAVRDALQHAADEIKVEADYSGSNRKAVLMWSVEKLRALIKEIQ